MNAIGCDDTVWHFTPEKLRKIICQEFLGARLHGRFIHQHAARADVYKQNSAVSLEGTVAARLRSGVGLDPASPIVATRAKLGAV